MTEIVDKTLIERLILEHSDRLELEINQKARADAWKFYFRVRVDHVIRPFAVCKVCYRVLHCDSRSGTASLLRHPCNPLSERSPVNRAVKLSAKLNLPTDGVNKNDIFKGDHLKSDLSHQIDSINNASLRQSPVSLMGGCTPTSNCPSPTSTGSPPTTNLTSLTVPTICTNGGRKRKVGVTPPTFPLDLRLLQLPQMMAAVAAHPLAALNLANATALLADPQHFHHLQQQQSHLEHILREHHLQQERELKRNREEESCATPDRNGSLSGEASSSSPTWGRPRVKKERADTSEETVVGSCEDHKETINHGGGRGRQNREDIDDPGGGMNKEMVQHLVSLVSERVQLSEKDSGGSHYISDVWSRFQVVFVDGILRPFAACKNCKKVVTYTKYSGTGGLLRHRCASHEARIRESPAQENIAEPSHQTRASPLIPGDNFDLSFKADSNFGVSRSSSIHSFVFPSSVSSQIETPSSRDSHEDNLTSPPTPTSTMAGIARALLRYMCHDLIAANTLDSPAFHQLVWTVLNLGATRGSYKEDEPLPSSKQLLQSYLPPIITDSKEIISRNLQDQNYLCLSIHCRQVGDSCVLAGSVHCITQEFQLQSHALGIKRFYKGESREEVLQGLLREFFQDLPPSSLREKYVTIVTDDGDASILGSTGVKCVWHSVESVLETLTEVVGYSKICDEVRNALACLADSGMDGFSSCNFRTSEVHRWEALLHAITFIVSHYDELQIVLNEAQTANNSSTPQTHLSEREIFEEVSELLMGVRRCLMTVRDFKRPTLNQAVLCRAKLLHLCSSPAISMVTQQVKEYLLKKLENALVLAPLHLVASFLDPRCKSLKVLNENEKGEVHRLVLDMMKVVSVTEANTGVLNLKTTRRNSSPGPAYVRDTALSDSAPEIHPFSEYMDNPGTDLSVSDSEEIMAYVNMKVHLDNDDILGWWAGPSASGLPTLRRLARKILSVPATCAFACQINAHAVATSEKMGILEPSQVNNVLHMRYNMS